MRDKNIKVTVIVPLYNGEKYLSKCLDSLKSQTLQDIEIILVDDGSTDRSGEICDKYASIDSKFNVLHRINGGSAMARQTGLDAAKGEYIIVCDSDDWIEPNIYEKLYHKAKETNADIVLCGYYAEYNNGKSIQCQTIFKEQNGIVDNFDFLKRGAGSSWVKLVRKSLFEETQSRYEPGINLSEDALIIYKLMRGNPKVVQIKDNLYHYRRLFGAQSYTNHINMNHIYQLRYTYDWLKGNYKEQKYLPLIHQRALDIVFACLRVRDLDKDYLRSFLKSELPFKSITHHKLTSKSIIVLALKILPYTYVKFIIGELYKYVYK